MVSFINKFKNYSVIILLLLAGYNAAFAQQPATRPKVASSSPANLALDVPITTTTISVTFDQDVELVGTTAKVEFYYEGYPYYIRATLNSDNRTLEFTVPDRLNYAANYFFNILPGQVKNAANMVNCYQTIDFSTEALAGGPILKSMTPASNASNIAVNLPTITVEFDKDIEETDYDLPLEIYNEDGFLGGIYNTSVIVSGRFATFTLPEWAILDYDTTYTIRLCAGSFHNSYLPNAGYTWKFRTAPVPAAAPKVKSTIPANNAQNIAINPTTITITFDKAIEATDNVVLDVLDEDGSLLDWLDNTYVIVSGRVATFNFSTVLDYSKTYTAVLSAGSFHNNNVFNAGYTWNFTTAPEPAAAPKVKSTIPAKNAQNIVVNPTTITITFDKDITETEDLILDLYDEEGFSVGMLDNTDVFVSGSVATFTVSDLFLLEYGKTYVAELYAGSFHNNNVLNAKYTWKFTTQALPQVTSIVRQDPTSKKTSEYAVSFKVTLNEAVNFEQSVDCFTVDWTGTPNKDAVEIFGFTPDEGDPKVCYVDVWICDNAVGELGLKVVGQVAPATNEKYDINREALTYTYSPKGANVDISTTNFVLTFNHNINSAPIPTLEVNGTSCAAGTVSDNTITYALPTTLVNATNYDIYVVSDPEVTDLWGNKCEVDNDFKYIGYFSTKGATGAPEVNSTTPANDAPNIAVNLSEITIEFNQNIEKTNNEILELYDEEGYWVSSSSGTQVSVSGSTATFTLPDWLILEYSKTYTAVLSAGSFHNNNVLNPEYSWNFTTQALPQVTSIEKYDPISEKTNTDELKFKVTFDAAPTFSVYASAGNYFTLDFSGTSSYMMLRDYMEQDPDNDKVFYVEVWCDRNIQGLLGLKANGQTAPAISEKYNINRSDLDLVIFSPDEYGYADISTNSIVLKFNKKLNDAQIPKLKVNNISCGMGTVTGNILTYTIPFALEPETQYTVTVTNPEVTDLWGNTYDVAGWQFTTKEAPAPTYPKVVSSSPALFAINVPVRIPMISVTFNQDIKLANPQGATATLSGGANSITLTATSVSSDKRTLVFPLPQNTLAYGTEYSLEINSNQVKNNPNPQMSLVNVYWKIPFSTEAAAEAPVVESTTPSTNAQNVAINPTTITITFDRAIEATNNALLELYNEDGGFVTSVNATQVNVSGSTATFNTSYILEYGKTYTAKLLAGSFHSSNVLSAGYNWKFTTEVPPAGVPVVQSTTPATNASNVAINPTITIIFDKTIEKTNYARLELYNEDGDYVASVNATEMSVSGSTATFTLSNALDYSKTYTAILRAGSFHNNDLFSAEHSWSFTTEAIPAGAPKVQLTTPDTDEQGVAVTPTTITIEFDKTIKATNNVRLDLYTEDGNYKIAGTGEMPFHMPLSPRSPLIITNVGVSGNKATFTFPNGLILEYGTTYIAKLSAGSFHNNNALSAGYSWNFTTEALPQVTSIVKYEPTSINTNADFVKFKVTFDTEPTFNPYVFVPQNYFTIDWMGTPTQYAAVIPLYVGNNITKDPNDNKVWYVMLAVSDNAKGELGLIANGQTVVSEKYNVNKKELKLVSYSPSGANVDITTSNLVLTFSENLNSTPIPTIIVNGTPCTGATVSANTITYDLPTLANGTEYQIFVGNERIAKDLWGNECEVGNDFMYIGYFSTPAATGAPEVNSTNPATDAANIAVNLPTITIEFKETITETNNAYLALYDDDGKLVMGTINVNVNNKVATFTLGSSLIYGRTYTAVLSAGSFHNNNILNPEYSWNFTTEAMPQVTKIEREDPTSDYTNSNLVEFKVTFDKAVKFTGSATNYFTADWGGLPTQNVARAIEMVSSQYPEVRYVRVVINPNAKGELGLKVKGQTAPATNEKYNVNTNALKLISYSPNGNAVETTTNSIVLTFNNDIKATPIPTLAVNNTPCQAGTVSGNKITYTLPNALDPETLYKVTVTNPEVTDLWGYKTKVEIWDFVTKAASATVSVTGVTLNKQTLTLTVGEINNTLSATVEPPNATNKVVTWESSNQGVATVDNTGKVTALTAGTTTITVTTQDGNKTAECFVTVNAATVSVTGVSLNHQALTLTVGEINTSLSATVQPADATNKVVTWESDNQGVATVDNAGKVTAKSVGNAKITVTTDDGGYTANCTVTVVTAPAVLSSIPAKNAQNVAINTPISITFDQNIELVGNSATVTLTAQGASSGIDLTAYNNVVNNNTLNFTLQNNLDNSTTYTLSIGADQVKNSANVNNAVNANIVTFTTIAAPPVVNATTPTGESGENVTVYLTTITVTFNKAITATNNASLILSKKSTPATAVVAMTAANVIVNGNTATFSLPTGNVLDGNTEYTATLAANSFQNSNVGNEQHSWNFKTQVATLPITLSRTTTTVTVAWFAKSGVNYTAELFENNNYTSSVTGCTKNPLTVDGEDANISHTFDKLSRNTTYYVKVTSTNEEGTGSIRTRRLKESIASADNSFEVTEVTPMPIKTDAQFTLATDKAGLLTVSVYGLAGEKLMDVLTTNLNAGDEIIVPMSFANFASGTYTLVISLGGETIQQRIVISK